MDLPGARRDHPPRGATRDVTEFEHHAGGQHHGLPELHRPVQCPAPRDGYLGQRTGRGVHAVRDRPGKAEGLRPEERGVDRVAVAGDLRVPPARVRRQAPHVAAGTGFCSRFGTLADVGPGSSLSLGRHALGSASTSGSVHALGEVGGHAGPGDVVAHRRGQVDVHGGAAAVGAQPVGPGGEGQFLVEVQRPGLGHAVRHVDQTEQGEREVIPGQECHREREAEDVHEPGRQLVGAGCADEVLVVREPLGLRPHGAVAQGDLRQARPAPPQPGTGRPGHRSPVRLTHAGNGAHHLLPVPLGRS